MTIKDLLKTLHCTCRKNLSYLFYKYESQTEWEFANYEELTDFINSNPVWQYQEIEYFSFSMDNFKSFIHVRIVEE